MISFFNLLLMGFVNGIAVRQYSDDSCTQFSSINYVKDSNCYSWASTGSYLIKSCNCTLIEYNLYDSSLCFGNIVGTFHTQQNTCLSTRQKISCYEDIQSGSNNIINIFVTISFNFIILLVT